MNCQHKMKGSRDGLEEGQDQESGENVTRHEQQIKGPHSTDVVNADVGIDPATPTLAAASSTTTNANAATAPLQSFHTATPKRDHDMKEPLQADNVVSLEEQQQHQAVSLGETNLGDRE